MGDNKSLMGVKQTSELVEESKNIFLVCARCENPPAIVSHFLEQALCKACFCNNVQDRVDHLIQQYPLFKPGDRIAVAVSGGKDSSVMAYLLNKLNQEKRYQWDLILIAIDEGIKGYRDPSLQAIQTLCQKYLSELPLKIYSFADLFGSTLDIYQSRLKLNSLEKMGCSVCGVLRRQALQIGALENNCNILALGHNGSDCAETLLLNMMRGDQNRLDHACLPATGSLEELKRVRPLFNLLTKDIVYYAKFNQLPYFSTECPHSAMAFRNHPRNIVSWVENSPHAKLLYTFLQTGIAWCRNRCKSKIKFENLERCTCGNLTTATPCRTCTVLSQLNEDRASLDHRAI